MDDGRLIESARPTIGSATSDDAAPTRTPMPTPISVRMPTWVRKWTMMRGPVAPRLRIVAIERWRSPT
jgi:hypothetical protein